MAVHSDIWLRGNKRYLTGSLIFPSLMLLWGAGLLFWAMFTEVGDWRTWLGLIVCVLGSLCTGVILRVGLLPRIAYDSDERAVVLYLPGPTAYRVPLDIVECFFLGSGITQIPGQPQRDVQTKNVVVRLAERATDWHRRDLTLSIGKWCEGYITIRGLYCEPLDIEVVKHLNTLLHQAQQSAQVPLPREPTLVQGQLLTTGLETMQDAPQ